MASEKDFTYKEYRETVKKMPDDNFHGNYSWDEDLARRRYETELQAYLAGDFSLQVFKAGVAASTAYCMFMMS